MRRFIRRWSELWGPFRIASPRGTVAFRVPHYEDSPLVSPRFARADAGVLALERTMGRWGARSHYLNWVLPLERSRLPLDRRMRRLGYTCAGDCRVKEFVEPRPLRLPRGYSALIGPVDGPLFAEYLEVAGRCFSTGRRCARRNRSLSKLVEAPTLLAVVRGRDGRPAAAGGVTVGRRTALLFGGAVVPGHRRRGLWRALVALRQAVARGRGVRLCLLQTSNPRLIGTADRSSRLLTYRKIA